MKKWVIISLALFIGACSTTKKSGDAADSGPKDTFTAPADPKPVSRGVYTQMEKALESKNDKQLFDLTEQALAQNPYDAKALNALALYHIRRKEWGAARILLERALEKNKLAGLENNLGVIDLMEDDLEGAVIHFKKAYDMDRKNPNLMTNLGSIYIKYLDYGRAENLIEDSYSYNSGSVNVMNNYAILLRSQGNYEKADGVYQKALAKDSRNISVLLNYAILLIEYMKKYNEGERLLNKLEFLESNDSYIKARIGQLHTKIRAARK